MPLRLQTKNSKRGICINVFLFHVVSNTITSHYIQFYLFKLKIKI